MVYSSCNRKISIKARAQTVAFSLHFVLTFYTPKVNFSHSEKGQPSEFSFWFLPRCPHRQGGRGSSSFWVEHGRGGGHFGRRLERQLPKTLLVSDYYSKPMISSSKGHTKTPINIRETEYKLIFRFLCNKIQRTDQNLGWTQHHDCQHFTMRATMKNINNSISLFHTSLLGFGSFKTHFF